MADRQSRGKRAVNRLFWLGVGPNISRHEPATVQILIHVPVFGAADMVESPILVDKSRVGSAGSL